MLLQSQRRWAGALALNAPKKAAAGGVAILSLYCRCATFLPRMAPSAPAPASLLCSLRITAGVPSRPHRCAAWTSLTSSLPPFISQMLRALDREPLSCLSPLSLRQRCPSSPWVTAGAAASARRTRWLAQRRHSDDAALLLFERSAVAGSPHLRAVPAPRVIGHDQGDGGHLLGLRRWQLALASAHGAHEPGACSQPPALSQGRLNMC